MLSYIEYSSIQTEQCGQVKCVVESIKRSANISKLHCSQNIPLISDKLQTSVLSKQEI